MAKYLRKFETTAEYESAKDSLILPNVSYITEGNDVEYNPYVEPPFFCKLTLNNGEVVELEGSGELTSTMIYSYESTLVSAEIGELCTSIGSNAFDRCTGLTSVEIPNSVTSIGSSAFATCRSLASIVIPDSVTSIGDYIFAGCSSLSSITSLAMTAPTIQSYTFSYIKTNGTLTVPSGSSGYNVWMQNADYYLGLYNWEKVEQ